MGSWNQCVALLREAENDRYCKLPNAKSFRRLPAATATFSRNTTYRLQPVVIEQAFPVHYCFRRNLVFRLLLAPSE